MSGDRLWLSLVAGGFLGLGLSALVDPGVVSAVRLDAGHPTAAADVRAVYGGLQLGIGAFLIFCARHDLRTGWRLSLACFTGLAAGRALGIIAAPANEPITWTLWALELAGVALSVGFLIRPATR